MTLLLAGLTIGFIAGFTLAMSAQSIKRYIWTLRNGQITSTNHPTMRADDIQIDVEKRDAVIANLNMDFDDMRAKARAARAARHAMTA